MDKCKSEGIIQFMLELDSSFNILSYKKIWCAHQVSYLSPTGQLYNHWFFFSFWLPSKEVPNHFFWSWCRGSMVNPFSLREAYRTTPTSHPLKQVASAFFFVRSTHPNVITITRFEWRPGELTEVNPRLGVGWLASILTQRIRWLFQKEY